MRQLKRKLKRLQEQLEKVEKDHCGNESDYTYWGGWSKGYIQGQISILEDLVDDEVTDDSLCDIDIRKNIERLVK